MLTVDKEAGMAREVGQFIINDGDGIDLIVDVAVHDEGEIAFDWTHDGVPYQLWLPGERVRQLLGVE